MGSCDNMVRGLVLTIHMSYPNTTKQRILLSFPLSTLEEAVHDMLSLPIYWYTLEETTSNSWCDPHIYILHEMICGLIGLKYR